MSSFIYAGQNIYIRPTRIVSLPEFVSDTVRYSHLREENLKNLKENQHKGKLSVKATMKIENAINWLLCAAEPKRVYDHSKKSFFNFKVNFITLTLPDTKNVVTNSFLQKNLLNPLLTYLREYQGLKNYVWKLEFQKNGKLHVHLVSDTFIHYRKIRTAWNRLLGANNLLLDFSEKFGHIDPNSTDIHSVKKVRNLAAYITKYMSKNSADLAKIKGRIWGCNQQLSAASKTKVFLDRDECVEQLAPLLKSKIENRSIGAIDKYTGIFRAFGEIFFPTFLDWQIFIKGAIRAAFDKTILALRSIVTSEPLVYSI